jgi:UDP-3-O-[3-hydroxymyristoyl] glucosamine N-acyltransferase
MTYISPRATVEPGVFIGQNVNILGPSYLHRGCIIEDNCIIGKPSRVQMERFKLSLPALGSNPTYADYDAIVDTPTILHAGVVLHSGTTLYSGCELGSEAICEDNALVRWDTQIGHNTKIMFGAFIGSYITIGHHCRIGGFCCNDVYIGHYVTSFGDLTHSYTQYGGGRRDPAPRLEDRVTVGFGVNIIGGVTIGTGSYVVANAVVSRDVPPETIVTDANVHHAMKDWKGSLRDTYLNSFPSENQNS